MHQTIVALFESRDAAERASRDLQDAGLPLTDLQIVSAGEDKAAADREPRGRSAPQHEEGFFAWLFGSDVPGPEVNLYHSHVYDRGRTLLSVQSTEPGLGFEQIVEIVDRHDPVEIDEGGDALGLGTATAGAVGMAAEASSGVTGPASMKSGGQETVIPTAKEELQVGKREVAGTRSYRVRSYVVQRPVEQQVTLRDERIVVERRPPGASAGTGQNAFQDKEFEVTERHEEPVVGKVVRPGEDVVVRRDVKDRVQTVRDTVRETKVDIDQAAAGNKPASVPGSGSTRQADPIRLPDESVRPTTSPSGSKKPVT
jgi:stress response protein YsnF